MNRLPAVPRTDSVAVQQTIVIRLFDRGVILDATHRDNEKQEETR